MTFPDSTTILIADDDPIVRKMIRFILRSIQVSFLEASSGSEALCLLKIHAPDLMFLDYDLGDMTASKLLEILSLEGIRPLNVILLTSYDQEFISNQHLEDQVARVISKPFSPNELLLLVRDFIS